jgi:hypothetical protein
MTQIIPVLLTTKLIITTFCDEHYVCSSAYGHIIKCTTLTMPYFWHVIFDNVFLESTIVAKVGTKAVPSTVPVSQQLKL